MFRAPAEPASANGSASRLRRDPGSNVATATDGPLPPDISAAYSAIAQIAGA